MENRRQCLYKSKRNCFGYWILHQPKYQSDMKGGQTHLLSTSPFSGTGEPTIPKWGNEWRTEAKGISDRITKENSRIRGVH